MEAHKLAWLCPCPPHPPPHPCSGSYRTFLIMSQYEKVLEL